MRLRRVGGGPGPGVPQVLLRGALTPDERERQDDHRRHPRRPVFPRRRPGAQDGRWKAHPLEERCGDMRALVRRFERWVKAHQLGLQVSGLALLLALVYLAPDIFIFIHPGRAGVLWRRFGGGTDLTNVYLEGLQVKSPFNVMYIYDVRIQRADAAIEVLSKDGLKIEIEATVRYHPVIRRLGRLHQRVGP